LIAAGADVNMQDNLGRTPLYAAVDAHTMPVSNRPSPKEVDEELSSLDVIKTLLARGAEVNIQLKAQQPYRTKLDRGTDGMLGPARRRCCALRSCRLCRDGPAV